MVLVKVDLVKVILVKVDPSDRTTGVDKDPGTGCFAGVIYWHSSSLLQYKYSAHVLDN